MLRRAADEGGSIVVCGKHLDAALRELVVQGGELTRSLLGFRSENGPASAATREDDANE